MAVTRISQSSLKQGLKKNKNFVAGIPPITGKYYLMGSVTVGAGGASSIEFTDIPPVYRHLQVRLIGRSSTTGANGDYFNLQINGDTGSNYAYHGLYVDGAAAYATALSSVSYMYWSRLATTSHSANIFGAGVFDILDYANTSKNTTVRGVQGYDSNGGGRLYLNSGLWASTSAVTSIKMTFTWAEHTTAALYGIGTAAQ
jgi:hypothetical protein